MSQGKYLGFQKHEAAASITDEDAAFLESYRRKLFDRYSFLNVQTDEDEVIKRLLDEKIILHVFKPSFKKCQHMDKGLREIAPRFPDTKFWSINIESCPKIIASLCITVLPFLGCFRDGLYVSHLVGFENL